MKAKCPQCQSENLHGRKLILKTGYYYRKSDSHWIPRYHCKNCGKNFSSASFSPAYGQNKRRLNPKTYQLLVSCVSQRRISRLLGCNLKTVARKLRYLSSLAEKELKKMKLSDISDLQFDEMETWEHSKLKPLSIFVMVDKKTRRLLLAKVSQMPAKGLIAKKSRKKYGKRKDHRKKDILEALKQIQPKLSNELNLESDESPRYPSLMQSMFPKANYKQYKGRRACVVGQGELKAGGKDPLFSLNHTCAMLRANINRLVRRTWCTTKKLECLQMHIHLYMHYHNSKLI